MNCDIEENEVKNVRNLKFKGIEHRERRSDGLRIT